MLGSPAEEQNRGENEMNVDGEEYELLNQVSDDRPPKPQSINSWAEKGAHTTFYVLCKV
jgi:hypothetical protein